MATLELYTVPKLACIVPTGPSLLKTLASSPKPLRGGVYTKRHGCRFVYLIGLTDLLVKKQGQCKFSQPWSVA